MIQYGKLGMLLLVGPAMAAFSAASDAATYYLQTNSGNIDWTTNTAVWWDQASPPGSGSHPANAAALSGQTFDVNGSLLTSTNGASTFPGALLLLNGTTDDGVNTRGAGVTHNITAVTVTSGTPKLVPGGDLTTVHVGTFTINGGASAVLDVVGGFNVTATGIFDFDMLTGLGDISLRSASSSPNVKTIRLTVDDATNWTGILGGWTNMTATANASLSLAFGDNTVFGGSLVVPAHGRITLDQDVTFAAVTLAGTVLDPGTYSFDYLNANFDAIFNNGGSGSITVVPEPATFALLGLGGLLMTFKRKARA